MAFNVSIQYTSPSDFFITPSAAAADFTNNKLELAKVPKIKQVQADLTAPSNPSLYWTGSRLEQVNQYGPDNDLTCVWDAVSTANYETISPAILNNNVSIVNGWGVFTGTQTDMEPAYFHPENFTLEMKVRNNTDVGSAIITFIQAFSNNTSHYMWFRILNGQLRFTIMQGFLVSNTTASLPLELRNVGAEYDLAFEFKNGSGGAEQDGFARIYLNGVLVAQDSFSEKVRNDLYSTFRFQPQGGLQGKFFRMQAGLKYDGNYTPVNSLPDTPFVESSETIIDGVYEGVGDITDYVTLTDNNQSLARYTVNGKWYNGASWVASNGSYAQATEASAMDLSLLAVDDNLYSVAVVFPATNAPGYVEAVQLDFNGEAYEQAISATTNASFPVTSFNDVVVSYSSPGDYTGVGFTFLIGSVPYYFNVNSQAWEVSDNSINQINTPEQLTPSVMELLNVPGSFKLTTFLYSLDEPETGYQNTESPSITLTNIDFNYQLPDLSPPTECLLYGLDRTVCTDPAIDTETIEYYMVIENPKTFFHGNTIVRKSVCEIEVTGPAAVMAHAFYETETISGVDGDYKYKFSMRKTTISTDARGNTVRINEDDLLGYAIVPNQQEYLFGDLQFSDTPGVNN